MKRVSILLALALCGCATHPRHDDLAYSATTPLSDQVHARYRAIGGMLCDNTLRKRFVADFNARFRSRLDALWAAHGAEDSIVLPTCSAWTGTEEQVEVRHRRAMDRFDRWLTSAEQAHGLR